MTIEDIAKLANTSAATVSRVVNNDKHVRPETRERVQKIIDDYNYRPNSAGKNLRLNKTFQVLAVLPTITNPFFSKVIEGFSDMALNHNYSLTFVVSDRDPDKEKSYLDKLVTKIVDGIVFFYPSLDAKLLESFSKQYPIVCIGATGTKGVSRVGISDYNAALEATKYLLDLGHKNIAIVRDYHNHVFCEEREAGYRSALTKAGIDIKDSYILRYLDKENSVAGLVSNAMALAEPPTAFFCFSDIYAISTLKCLTDSGYNVGEGIDIIGFDNIDFSQLVTPSLTTVSQPGYQMGECAFELLLEKMENISALPKEILFPHRIIFRASTSNKKK